MMSATDILILQIAYPDYQIKIEYYITLLSKWRS